jgi:hypothetical protein
VAFAGITISVMFNTSRCPASFCFCGVLRFVLDGTTAEDHFEPPPACFASFLVGELNNFSFVFRRRLPLVTRLLVASAGDVFESESVTVQERKERKKATEERLERRTKDGGHGRERRKKATQKHFCVEGSLFGKSQQKQTISTSLERRELRASCNYYVPV